MVETTPSEILTARRRGLGIQSVREPTEGELADPVPTVVNSKQLPQKNTEAVVLTAEKDRLNKNVPTVIAR